MINLSFEQVIMLHEKMLAATGGHGGLRDEGAILLAVNNAKATFDGIELH